MCSNEFIINKLHIYIVISFIFFIIFKDLADLIL